MRYHLGRATILTLNKFLWAIGFPKVMEVELNNEIVKFQNRTKIAQSTWIRQSFDFEQNQTALN